jgi:hypothetical protein
MLGAILVFFMQTGFAMREVCWMGVVWMHALRGRYEVVSRCVVGHHIVAWGMLHLRWDP